MEYKNKINRSLQQICTHALLDAPSLGSQGLPGESESSAPFFLPYHQRFYGLLQELIMAIQPESLRMRLQSAIEAKDESIRKLTNELTECRKRLVSIKDELVHIRPKQIKRETIAILLTPFICSFDAIYSYPVFYVFGLSYSEARFAAVLFGLMLAVFAISFPKLLIASGRNKTTVAVFATVAIIVAFYCIGLQRAEYLTALAREAGEETEYSALGYAALASLTLFIATMLNFSPETTIEENETATKYAELLEEKKTIKARIIEIETEYRKIEEETQQFVSEAVEQLEIGDNLTRQIIETAHGCFADWKIQNRLARPNGGVPYCMNEPYPFSFTPTDSKSKMYANENN